LVSRKTEFVSAPFLDLERIAQEMWMKYLESTGHAHMTLAVLGIEGVECVSS